MKSRFKTLPPRHPSTPLGVDSSTKTDESKVKTGSKAAAVPSAKLLHDLFEVVDPKEVANFSPGLGEPAPTTQGKIHRRGAARSNIYRNSNLLISRATTIVRSASPPIDTAADTDHLAFGF